MRVVYFAHFAGGMDAASAMDADLFEAIRARGHEVVVLSPFRDPAVGRVGGNVGVGRLPRLLLALIGYLRMLVAGLRLAHAPDACLVSQYHVFHPATAIAFLVARLADRPLIARAHDPLPGSYRSGVEAAMNRTGFRLYRRILAHAHTWVLVPSPELRDVAVERLGLSPSRVLVLPNNVTETPDPGTDAVERLRDSLGLAGARVVLQFGSFTQRGTATFVHALRLLGPNTRGLILADPSRGATFVREAKRQGISDRLLALETRPYREVRSFVALADVCVGLLSDDVIARGSLPRNTLEAMAAGRPVVLCRGVVSSSLVEDGGNCLLVPPGDAESLAHSIERLLADPGLASALGARARESVRTRFQSDAVAGAFESLLAQIPGALRA